MTHGLGSRDRQSRMKLERLDEPTRALVALAAAIAIGNEPDLEAHCTDCVGPGVPPLWVDELLLQSVLILGWPRALTAARIWRHAEDTGGRGGAVRIEGEDGSDYGRFAEWRERGERVCAEVYGDTYLALRRNIRHLHPDLEAGMIVEGYGRILGRPGLDQARRELCSVAQIAVLGARRQLRAHLTGALNVGASSRAVQESLEVVRPLLDPEEWKAVTVVWERAQP